MKNQSILFYFLCSTALSWIFFLAGCATNPVTKQPEFVLMSEEQELQIGREMNPKILKEFGIYPSDQLQNYVESVGKRVAEVSHRSDLFFHFTVVNSPVVNAFALPGGYIYITRGLLAYVNTESELAGVLGHEIGHVTARHAVRQYTQVAGYSIAAGIASIFIPEINTFGQIADIAFTAITRGYSREYEREADRLGIEYALKAGYDSKAVSSFLQTLELLAKDKGEPSYHSLFATHPKTEERITLTEAEAALAGTSPKTPLIIGREKYLSTIDGLHFGSDPEEGVIIGNKFQHPDLRIELEFPKGWSIENKPDAVIANQPDRDIYFQLCLETLSKKTSAARMAQQLSGKLGFRESSGASTTISGLDAYVGTYVGRSQKLGKITARIGFIVVEDILHYIIGYSRSEEFFQALPLFNKTINSFRELSLREASAIEPARIRLHTVAAGESIASICDKTVYSAPDEAKTVSLINAMDPATHPALKSGMIIKVIENK